MKEHEACTNTVTPKTTGAKPPKQNDRNQQSAKPK